MMVFFIIDVSTKNHNAPRKCNNPNNHFILFWKEIGRLTFMSKIVAYDVHVPYTDFEFIFWKPSPIINCIRYFCMSFNYI